MENRDYKKAFHLRFGDRRLIPDLKELITKVLLPHGINMIILEIDKAFVFEKHPEIDGGSYALTADDAKDLSQFTKERGMEIVPLFQCLGHQGWGGSRSALLTAYPEFDETPETPLDAEWPEIFSRSWCPQHPDVNKIVYDLLDELIAAFSPTYFHIGMDEVYEIASDQCERCRGGNRAELFAKAVNDMYDHITEQRGLTMMMWADRLIDARKFGYDNWEGDTFGTYEAIDKIPRDIVLLDWHYDEREKGYPTPYFFMEAGFSVMPACWFKLNVAKQLFAEAKAAAKELNQPELFFGKLITSWNGWSHDIFQEFIHMKEKTLIDKGNELARLYEVIETIE